jgi:GNAT superfamily N-acetyltransferase
LSAAAFVIEMRRAGLVLCMAERAVARGAANLQCREVTSKFKFLAPSFRQSPGRSMLSDNIRLCRPDERSLILAIVNAAAERYRGAIPADCWHEPYMSADQLECDIGAGITFWGAVDEGGQLVGVMGIQQVKDVDLIRHAYVRPDQQGKGVGARLLAHLEGTSSRQILIGTWADAAWAIRFYRGRGYTLVPPNEIASLLTTYWTISARQIETSVVLAKPALTQAEVLN